MRTVLALLTFLLIPTMVLAQNSPPVVDAGPDQTIITDTTTRLQGSATDPDGDAIVQWQWAVESAEPGSSPSIIYPFEREPQFTADVAGSYVLSLIAFDGTDWSEPDFVTISMRDLLPPEAVIDADVTTGPAPLTVQFDGSASSTDPIAEPLTFFWSFGDGYFSPAVAPTHTFERPDSYLVGLVVVDDLGQSDEMSIEIIVTAPGNNPPVADAGPDQNIFLGESVTLQGSATDPDGDIIVGWEWEVVSAPGGSNYSLADADTPDAQFSTDTIGNYVLTLIAWDGIAWSDPDAVLVMVVENLPPTAVASASPLSGPAPLLVSFDGTASSDPEGGALLYNWDFGDLSDGTGATPSHEYLDPDIYQVVLKVTDDFGNIDFDTVEITVTAPNNPPQASPTATPNSGNAPLEVQFNANATDPDSDDLTYLWDFGDPDSGNNTSTLADPVHTYETPSTYTVWVTVSDGQHEVSESLTVVVSAVQHLSTRRAHVIMGHHNKGVVSYWADIDLPMPSADDVIALRFDGIKLFNKPFSEFKPGLKEGVYLIVKRRLLVRINFNNNRIYILKRKVNLKKFDNTDGVDVELTWGEDMAVDQFDMTQINAHKWEYTRGNSNGQ